MIFTVEPMINVGSYKTKLLTMVGLLSLKIMNYLLSMNIPVLVTDNGSEILTLRSEESADEFK